MKVTSKVVVLFGLGFLLIFAQTAFAITIDGAGYSQTGGSTTFFGETTNNASVWLTNAQLLIDGPFYNNGAFITNGSTLDINGDVTVGAAGYFQGTLGDVYTFHGSYFNQSNSVLWDTSNVDLVMTSDGDISINGAMGPFRTVNISAGGTLTINGSISTVGDLWATSGHFILPEGFSWGDVGNVGGSFVIMENGGPITVTPEPVSSVLFLLGAGVFGAVAKKRRIRGQVH